MADDTFAGVETKRSLLHMFQGFARGNFDDNEAKQRYDDAELRALRAHALMRPDPRVPRNTQTRVSYTSTQFHGSLRDNMTDRDISIARLNGILTSAVQRQLDDAARNLARHPPGPRNPPRVDAGMRLPDWLRTVEGFSGLEQNSTVKGRFDNVSILLDPYDAAGEDIPSAMTGNMYVDPEDDDFVFDNGPGREGTLYIRDERQHWGKYTQPGSLARGFDGRSGNFLYHNQGINYFDYMNTRYRGDDPDPEVRDTNDETRGINYMASIRIGEVPGRPLDRVNSLPPGTEYSFRVLFRVFLRNGGNARTLDRARTRIDLEHRMLVNYSSPVDLPDRPPEAAEAGERFGWDPDADHEYDYMY